MKKVLVCFCVLLLVLYKPIYSCGFSSKNLDILKLKQLYTSNHSTAETMFMDACLSEEETEDTGTSAKGKFSSSVTAAIIGYLIANNYTSDSLDNNRFPDPFSKFYEPSFIFFRVLRL